MFYTPRKSLTGNSPRTTPTSPEKTKVAGSSPKATNEASNVRRSIGEWETKGPGKSQAKSTSPINIASNSSAPLGSKPKTAPTQEGKETIQKASVEALVEPQGPEKRQRKSTDRVTQARNWLRRAKTHLNESRNLKTDLKTGITLAVEELFKLVKEEAEERKKKNGNTGKKDGTFIKDKGNKGTMTVGTETCIASREAINMLEWQKHKIEETLTEMVKLREAMNTLQSTTPMQPMTYAEKVATSNHKNMNNRGPALHSIVIAPKDENDTGEQVLERVRKAVNAKDGWVTVEKVRKVKDRKVIVGCRTKEERDKVKERLKSVEDHLHVEEMKNQDPMLVLRDVLQIHSDDDILTSLRKQNGAVFNGLDMHEDRLEIRYRRTARNPHTRHVVIRVSPALYNRMMEKEKVHIDMQNVRVADQSPLVQCSICLGYGHGRRYCKETEPKCSHCGGLHMKEKCTEWMIRATPCCTNCTNAKLEDTDHNAFSEQCPIRRRWEALARAKIAYC